MLVSSSGNTVLEGANSAEGLKAAIAKIAGEVQEAKKEEGNAKAAPKKAAKGSDDSASWTPATADTLNSLCETKLCVLGFGDAAHDKAVLTAVLAAYKRDGKFNFVQPSSDVRAKFGIDASTSTFVVYNARKGRYAKTDALSEADAKVLLDRVVGGDVKWTNL